MGESSFDAEGADMLITRWAVGSGVVVALVAGACAAPADTPPVDTTAPDAMVDRAFYACPDDLVFAVDYFADGARLTLGDRTVRLLRHPADPARFGDGSLQLEMDDGEALLSDGGETVRCHAEGTGEVWRDAIRRGVVFRGLGQEPGWLVELDGDGEMEIVLDYGAELIQVAVPPPDRTERGLEYHVRTPFQEIRLLIEDRPCRDIMSGEPFPSTITLRVDGRTYDGCGIRLR
jgi:hypothetical protein